MIFGLSPDDLKVVHAGVTGVVLLAMVAGLIASTIPPEIILLTALTALMVTGVLSPAEGLAGFSNSSLLTLAGLLALGAGLQGTGAMEYLGRWLVGTTRRGLRLPRVLVPVATMSAFVNNTPLVAIFMPILVQRAQQSQEPPSRVLLPLSYAAMLGGMCTLIGTSTNLVVNSQLVTYGAPSLGMFELAWIGLPITVLGLIYVCWASPYLLPRREDLLERVEDNPREYFVEMVVLPECPLVGQTVRQSGLRDLSGLSLIRIDRAGETILPVRPGDQLHAHDVLIFSGIISTVVDLQRIRGLVPVDHRPVSEAPRPTMTLAEAAATSSLDSLEGLPPDTNLPTPAKRVGRQLCEVVISPTSPLIGQSIRDSNFRSRYDAGIIAVHRGGHKIEQKIGQIVLESGDVLLIDADDRFPDQWRNSPDFNLVSGVKDSAPIAHEKTWLAMWIFALVVAGMTLLPARATVIVFAGTVAMFLTGCMRMRDAQRRIDLPLLVMLAAALGIGTALGKSGLDAILADFLLTIKTWGGPTLGNSLLLATLFVITSVLSHFLSNNATAALMGVMIITSFGAEGRALLICVAIAASTAFGTHVGYQTNAMVRNAGGYSLMDYVRFGMPLNLMALVVTVALIPWIWPMP